MSSATPALQEEPIVVTPLEVNHAANVAATGPRRLPVDTAIRAFPTPPRKDTNFPPRIPAIIGEAIYRGLIPADGVITGQLGTKTTLTIKQRPKVGLTADTPELNGELTFKDMLRINGHIAGKVFSPGGTLIVDSSARVEASIDVGVCVISGRVEGDVIGHERVEVGSGAVVTGNISTPVLSIKPGAIFTGECRMIKAENGAA